MKKRLDKLNHIFCGVTGFIGGAIFAILLNLYINNLAHFASFTSGYLHLAYFVIFVCFSILGVKQSNYFALFFSVIFNLFANDGSGSEHDGTHDGSWKDFLMGILYLIGIGLLIIGTLFHGKPLILISFIFVFLYGIHAMKEKNNQNIDPTR